ncbi:MAG TPA: sensor domain-containing protein [Ktedonobacteraceae bacterium]
MNNQEMQFYQTQQEPFSSRPIHTDPREQPRKKQDMGTHLHTTQKSTTVGNITFLLLSFPLGLTYFLLVVIGLVLGVSTLIIWIGLPILFATLILIQGMAAIERRMATNLLHVSFPYPRYGQDVPQQGFLRRFGNVLRDPLTWTSTIYMILKLPLGIISFTLALVLPIVAGAVTVLPLVYLINLFVNVILLKSGIQSTGIIIPYFIEVRGQFDLVMFARSFIGIPVGLALWFVTRSLLNGLALFSGEMARALLSPGEADVMMTQPDQHYAPPMSHVSGE